MVSAQSATWSISMRAGEVQPFDRALPGGEPLEGGRLEDGGLAAEVDDLVDLGALRRDGGDEGVAVDHPPRVGDRDRALPAISHTSPGRHLAAVEGGEVDPDDHLGERPVLDHRRRRLAARRAGRAVDRAEVGQRGEGVSGVGLRRFAVPERCGPGANTRLLRPRAAPSTSCCAGGEQPVPVAHAVGIDPVRSNRFRAPARPARAPDSVDAARTIRAASFSVSFVDRPSAASAAGDRRRGRPSPPRRCALASRVDTFPAFNASNVSGAASTVSAVCNSRTASPNRHAGDVDQPVRRGTVTAPLPEVGLGHPTSRQRHPRRRQMLQPRELLHQVHRVTQHPSDPGRTHPPTTRWNRRRTRPPGPASRSSPVAPSNPYPQPYSGGVTVLPGCGRIGGWGRRPSGCRR